MIPARGSMCTYIIYIQYYYDDFSKLIRPRLWYPDVLFSIYIIYVVILEGYKNYYTFEVADG